MQCSESSESFFVQTIGIIFRAIFENGAKVVVIVHSSSLLRSHSIHLHVELVHEKK